MAAAATQAMLIAGIAARDIATIVSVLNPLDAPHLRELFGQPIGAEVGCCASASASATLKGPSSTWRLRQGLTPIHFAVTAGDVSILRLLLDCEPTAVNVRDQVRGAEHNPQGHADAGAWLQPPALLGVGHTHTVGAGGGAARGVDGVLSLAVRFGPACPHHSTLGPHCVGGTSRPRERTLMKRMGPGGVCCWRAQMQIPVLHQAVLNKDAAMVQLLLKELDNPTARNKVSPCLPAGVAEGGAASA
jgi:hypothetical protein